jgi:hypothetical protein
VTAQRLFRVGVSTLIAVAAAAPAFALPTMIRLGYPTCGSCHISPQGGGPLNEYGRGIDQAQSLRAGEYKPPSSVGMWSLWGRVTQDVRTVLQEQQTWTTDKPDANLFRPRLMYRNVTKLGAGFRVSGVVTAESEHVLRPASPYDPAATAATLFVNTAMLQYRIGESVEIAAGRDQLPSGINIPDLGVAIKAREHMGYYDAPTQLKMFLTGKRYQIAPFVYAPGGNDPHGEAERGAGTLAEVDLAGNGRTMVGMSVARGVADNGTRRTLGAYARLGFGPWGILAEHDVTDRTRPALISTSFQQQTTYAQLFWAMREWLVASAIGERLTVQQPFEERFAAARFELNARLTSQATIGISGRIQRNLITSAFTNSIMLQGAFKTVR